MGSYGALHTEKTWTECLHILKQEMERWGKEDYVLPTLAESKANGRVRFSFATNGKWIEPIDCSIGPTRWAPFDPATSLRAITIAIEGARKADQRGIGALLAAATKHLALPADSPYRVLGVPEGTTDKEALRKAYTGRVKEVHPDMGGDAQEFARVQKAAEQLGVV